MGPTLWVALVCILMVDGTQAGRKLQQQQQQAPKQRILQPYYSDTNGSRHAPPVQSFLVSDGSWVDCIPIEGQIAAHHPSLKNHVIRTAPSSLPRRPPSSSRHPHPQLFAREHGSCPEGSIPVLRDDPAGRFIKKARPPTITAPAATDSKHEYAVTGLPNVSRAYTGAHSIFSVNDPTLGSSSHMSLSQIWIVDGEIDDHSRSTIEVGWQVQPQIYEGSDVPHLFIFWTNDDYTSFPGPGACYNVRNCAGFVQRNNAWVIGGAMPGYTSLAQNAAYEVEVEIEVLYDPVDTSWWLYLNNDVIGYWPSSIYVNGKMQGTASRVKWGGEVAVGTPTGVAHSTTAMGSGAFPSAGYPVAAYQRKISYADASGTHFDADPVLLQNRRSVDNPLCYDIQVQLFNDIVNEHGDWGSYFFFGGPGGSAPGCHY